MDSMFNRPSWNVHLLATLLGCLFWPLLVMGLQAAGSQSALVLFGTITVCSAGGLIISKRVREEHRSRLQRIMLGIFMPSVLWTLVLALVKGPVPDIALTVVTAILTLGSALAAGGMLAANKKARAA